MKIDTTQIDGYADMSAEDKLAALESFEFEAPKAQDTGELERLKAALSKSNSEAADYKRQLRAKQTDEEARIAKEEEERTAIMQELENLKKEKMIGTLKSSYLELGYDAEMAADSAKALHAGDFTKVYENQRKFTEAQRKAAKSSAMDNQPGLSEGEPLSAKNSADAMDMNLRKWVGLPV